LTPFFKKNTVNFPPETPNFKPVCIQEVEISEPLPAVSAFDSATGQTYQRALSLVRLHRQPLGLVALSLSENGLTAADYACRIWDVLSARIKAHLHDDGLPDVDQLGPDGISFSRAPNCIKEHKALLSDAPFVSIVVATRDRAASLVRCVESLQALNYPSYEIIIVDNAPSSSATADLIRQKYGESDQVHYLSEPLPGLANAHNRGLMAVQAPIVAFTDDDVVVDALWLAQLVKGFAVNGKVGCVTGMILPAELQTPAQMWIEQYGSFNKGFTQRLFDQNRNRPDNPLYPYAAGIFGSGANMAFRTSVLRRIGGFDPALGAGSGGCGGDDLAAFFDVITKGYTLVYEPSAMIWHRHHRSYAKLRKLTYGYGVGLTAYLMKTLIDRPNRLLDFSIRIPQGLIYAMNPRSSKNSKKSTDYPRELTKIERKGMLYGPVAYLGSRWRSRKTRRRIGLLTKSRMGFSNRWL
jgi:GT2 family glycosyltransferase